MTYASAGHNPPAVVHKREREVSWLRPTAPAIGLAEEFHSRTETVTLKHGDILFLYTDGVTEAFNPTQEQFGSQRLGELLGNSVDLGANDIIQTVRHGLEVFGDGQVLEDDTTFVVLKLFE